METAWLKVVAALLAMQLMSTSSASQPSKELWEASDTRQNDRATPSSIGDQQANATQTTVTTFTVADVPRLKRSSRKSGDHHQSGKSHSHKTYRSSSSADRQKKHASYPYEDGHGYRHTYEETHEHIDEEYPNTGDMSEYRDHSHQASHHSEKYATKHSMESSDHAEHEESKKHEGGHEKVKVKHHHHHHHHNHVKEIIKRVPQPYPVEKIVRVPVEKIVEKVVHVPKPYPVEKIVEKKVPYPVEKIVEKVVNIPVEKIVHVPKPYPVEKIVHVPVDKIVEKVVEKFVPKPYPVEKVVEKVVHVPRPYPVEKIVHVPVEKIIEKFIHVPQPYAVEKIVEKRVPYPVERLVHVPVEKVVEKVVNVPKPYPVHVPKPYPVVKSVPFPVEIKVPVQVERKVPYKGEMDRKVPSYLNSHRGYQSSKEVSDNAQPYQYDHEKQANRNEHGSYALYDGGAHLNQPDYRKLKIDTELHKQQYENFGYKDNVHPSSDLDDSPSEQKNRQLHQQSPQLAQQIQSSTDLQTQASTNGVQYLHFPMQVFRLQPMPFQPVGFSVANDKSASQNQTPKGVS